jgi:ComF family protein
MKHDPAVPTSIAASLHAALDAALTVLLAPRCAACDALLVTPLSGAVCDDCWNAIRPITPPVCDGCGDPLPAWRAISLDRALCARCRRVPRIIVRGRAIGEYAGSLRAIVHALKYDRRASIAVTLGGMMAQRGRGILDGTDAVIPVPLHPRRARARGFNQADLLARQLGRPVWKALKRIRETAPQVDLPEAQRHRNVRGAFAACGGSDALRGAVVVIVDDVSTTGATLGACARVLREAGAKEVRALTAAKAVRKRP